MTAAAIAILMFAASSQAFGQKFKPGDKVECDPVGVGDYLKGTVVEYLENDNPTYKGEYYVIRVKLDKWTLYPEGVLCKTERVRFAKAAVAPPPKETTQKEDKNQPNQNQPNENEPTAETAEFGAKFKPGDRVECDSIGIGKWFKGTVLPFEKNDEPEKVKDKSGKYFYIHRVRLDFEASIAPKGIMCFTDRTRLLTDGAPLEIPKTDVPIGNVTTDENNTLSADRPIMECPVEQPKVKNGARPNPELLKKIIRCDKGEQPASKGMDGAVTVDVTAIQIAAPRQWILFTRRRRQTRHGYLSGACDLHGENFLSHPDGRC